MLAVRPVVGAAGCRLRSPTSRTQATVCGSVELLRFREVADLDDWAAGWGLTISVLRRSEVLGCH